jgi:hypothetical protein
MIVGQQIVSQQIVGQQTWTILKWFKVAEKYATLWSHYKTRITSIESSAVNHYKDS